MSEILTERVREVRRMAGAELRRVDGGGAMLRGYASVTDHPYDVIGGPADGGWTETIARGAFRRTLGMAANRALLSGHDHSQVLGTTRSGAVSMTEDGVGLLVEARLDTRVSWIADLATQIESGDIDEMSIGFYSRRSDWSPDYTERTIFEVELVEASVVWAGANPATVASIERMRSAVAEARARVSAPVVGLRARVAAQAAAAQLLLR